MDYKMAAAGEKVSETGCTEREKILQEKRLDMAEQALDFLVTFTQAKLSPEQTQNWIARLSTVPPWKLMMLAEFNSPYIAEVWKFFDGLRQQGEVYQAPALPEPKSNIAKDTFAYVKKLMDDSLSSVEKDALEKNHILALRKKYPHLNWMCGRPANKGARSDKSHYT